VSCPLHRSLVAQLRIAYYESRLSYADIAERAQMSEVTVWRAMNGRPINTAILLRLCAVLRRTVKLDPAVTQ
jgi:transcriptional regulator with XRE-family HTH domain